MPAQLQGVEQRPTQPLRPGPPLLKTNFNLSLNFKNGYPFAVADLQPFSDRVPQCFGDRYQVGGSSSSSAARAVSWAQPLAEEQPEDPAYNAGERQARREALRRPCTPREPEELSPTLRLTLWGDDVDVLEHSWANTGGNDPSLLPEGSRGELLGGVGGDQVGEGVSARRQEERLERLLLRRRVFDVPSGFAVALTARTLSVVTLSLELSGVEFWWGGSPPRVVAARSADIVFEGRQVIEATQEKVEKASRFTERELAEKLYDFSEKRLREYAKDTHGDIFNNGLHFVADFLVEEAPGFQSVFLAEAKSKVTDLFVDPLALFTAADSLSKFFAMAFRALEDATKTELNETLFEYILSCPRVDPEAGADTAETAPDLAAARNAEPFKISQEVTPWQTGTSSTKKKTWEIKAENKQLSDAAANIAGKTLFDALTHLLGHAHVPSRVLYLQEHQLPPHASSETFAQALQNTTTTGRGEATHSGHHQQALPAGTTGSRGAEAVEANPSQVQGALELETPPAEHPPSEPAAQALHPPTEDLEANGPETLQELQAGALDPAPEAPGNYAVALSSKQSAVSLADPSAFQNERDDNGHSHNSSNPAPKAKSRPRTTFLCCLPTQNPSAAETVRRELPLGFRHKLFPWNSSVLVFDDTGAPSSESSTDPAEIERMVAAVMDLPPEAKKELKEILVDSRVLRLDFQGKSGANIAGGVSWRVMTPEEEEWADALMQEGAEQVKDAPPTIGCVTPVVTPAGTPVVTPRAAESCTMAKSPAFSVPCAKKRKVDDPPPARPTSPDSAASTSGELLLSILEMAQRFIEDRRRDRLESDAPVEESREIVLVRNKGSGGRKETQVLLKTTKVEKVGEWHLIEEAALEACRMVGSGMPAPLPSNFVLEWLASRIVPEDIDLTKPSTSFLPHDLTSEEPQDPRFKYRYMVGIEFAIAFSVVAFASAQNWQSSKTSSSPSPPSPSWWKAWQEWWSKLAKDSGGRNKGNYKRFYRGTLIYETAERPDKTAGLPDKRAELTDIAPADCLEVEPEFVAEFGRYIPMAEALEKLTADSSSGKKAVILMKLKTNVKRASQSPRTPQAEDETAAQRWTANGKKWRSGPHGEKAKNQKVLYVRMNPSTASSAAAPAAASSSTATIS